MFSNRRKRRLGCDREAEAREILRLFSSCSTTSSRTTETSYSGSSELDVDNRQQFERGWSNSEGSFNRPRVQALDSLDVQSMGEVKGGHFNPGDSSVDAGVGDMAPVEERDTDLAGRFQDSFELDFQEESKLERQVGSQESLEDDLEEASDDSSILDSHEYEQSGFPESKPTRYRRSEVDSGENDRSHFSTGSGSGENDGNVLSSSYSSSSSVDDLVHTRVSETGRSSGVVARDDLRGSPVVEPTFAFVEAGGESSPTGSVQGSRSGAGADLELGLFEPTEDVAGGTLGTPGRKKRFRAGLLWGVGESSEVPGELGSLSSLCLSSAASRKLLSSLGDVQASLDYSQYLRKDSTTLAYSKGLLTSLKALEAVRLGKDFDEVSGAFAMLPPSFQEWSDSRTLLGNQGLNPPALKRARLGFAALMKLGCLMEDKYQSRAEKDLDVRRMALWTSANPPTHARTVPFPVNQFTMEDPRDNR